MVDQDQDDLGLTDRLRAKVAARFGYQPPPPVEGPLTITSPTITREPRTSNHTTFRVAYKVNGVDRWVLVQVSDFELTTTQAVPDMMALVLERGAAAILEDLSRK